LNIAAPLGRAGDGAGILVQIPHPFFAKAAAKLGFALPAPGEYAVGNLFMPRDPDWRQVIRDIYAREIARAGMALLGWRDIPSDNSTLGESVKPTEPVHQQVFIGRGRKIKNENEFERRLYILRKTISGIIYERRERRFAGYYPVSLSCRTVIYKGMFLADQLGTYYPDLHDSDFESALALVQSMIRKSETLVRIPLFASLAEAAVKRLDTATRCSSSAALADAAAPSGRNGLSMRWRMDSQGRLIMEWTA
jgi:glutamate synthase domain-containing protein 1